MPLWSSPWIQGIGVDDMNMEIYTDQLVGQRGGSSFIAPVTPRPTPLRGYLIENSLFPRVKVAEDYSVLREIGRLRHVQYIARQMKGYKSAVLDCNCLLEATDFQSVNLYTRDNNGLRG
jgi:hypothetical protein